MSSSTFSSTNPNSNWSLISSLPSISIAKVSSSKGVELATPMETTPLEEDPSYGVAPSHMAKSFNLDSITLAFNFEVL